MANTSGAPSQTLLELKAMDGSSTAGNRALMIPAGGQVARYLDELFPALPSGFRGMLKITSTQALVTTSLRVRSDQYGDMIVSSVPVSDDTTPVNSSDLVFPLIIKGGGYSTDFIGPKP
jgi:hypothetical protein